MYKKRQVISLKGTEDAKIGELLISGNGTMFVANCDPILIKPIYIYILSDDPIKRSDWVICNSRVQKVDTLDIENNGVKFVNPIYNGYISSCKKVIATNDPELNKGWIRDEDPQREHPEYVMITTMNGLPKLSDTFIQQFIHRYNIKHPITDIMVEYGFTIDKSLGHFHQQRKYFLKVNPDNTVNTKEEKRTWSRSEVEELLRSLDDGSGYFTSILIDNFIYQNL